MTYDMCSLEVKPTGLTLLHQHELHLTLMHLVTANTANTKPGTQKVGVVRPTKVPGPRHKKAQESL